MEKPDSNGFVHINWPSRNIPHGGVFHSKIVEHSTEREKILKVLIEESKLSIEQHRKDGWGLRRDTDTKTDDTKKSFQSERQVIRPQTSRRRSLSEIRSSGVLDIDNYRPLSRGEDRERMKQKLQEFMAWGHEKPKQTSPAPKQVVPPSKSVPTAKDMRNEYLTQIRERVEWLADMEVLGEGDKHRDIIQHQIMERMRNLEALGVDSECSSLADSGFSTVRSTVEMEQPKSSSAKSGISTTSVTTGGNNSAKQKPTRKGRKPNKVDENVAAYDSPKLQYSLRK